MCKRDYAISVTAIMPSSLIILTIIRLYLHIKGNYLYFFLTGTLDVNIFIVTYVLLFERDFNYGRTRKKDKFQGGNFENTARPKSSSGKCQRRVIYEQQVFRLSGSGAGQIRNDPPGLQGWVVGRSGGPHIWIFPGCILPSQNSFRKSRLTWLDPLTVGSQGASQTIAGYPSVYHKIAGRRSCAKIQGSIKNDRATVRNINSSSNDRTCNCTYEKKTIGETASQKQVLVTANDEFQKLYEKLRGQALETFIFNSRESGIALFIHQGMTIWMQKCSPLITQQQYNRSQPTTQISSSINISVTNQIVSVLTNMIIHSTVKEVTYGRI